MNSETSKPDIIGNLIDLALFLLLSVIIGIITEEGFFYGIGSSLPAAAIGYAIFSVIDEDRFGGVGAYWNRQRGIRKAVLGAYIVSTISLIGLSYLGAQQ